MAGYIGSKAVNLSTTGADINGDANIDGNLSFRDNDKIKLGAGSDLQIYHDGSHSIIQDAGTGDLRLYGNNVKIKNADNTAAYIQGINGAEVNLYYNNALKLATTSTGIDVTGTVTADSLTVQGVSTVEGKLSGFGPNAVFETTGTAKLRLDDLSSTSQNRTFITNNYSRSVSGFSADNSSFGVVNIGLQDGFISFDTAASGNNYPSEAMRIDSSGNLLVGKTTSDNTNNGHRFLSDGFVSHVRNNDIPMALYRKTSDGEILRFSKDSTTVGSIGTAFGELYITDGSSGLRIQSGEIKPVNSTGAGSDNTIDLGSSSHRFKDLYLSGGIKIVSPDTTSAAAITFGDSADAATGSIGYFNSDDSLRFSGYNNSEAMRIDSSGNLLVGKTAHNATDQGIVANASGRLWVTTSSDDSIFNRVGTDGGLLSLRKNGSEVGSIGVVNNTDPYFASSNRGLRISGNNIRPCTGSGANLDDTIDLGDTGQRFDDIYATNGTIQTSDRNEKQDIAELTDAEQRVAVAAKGLLRKFRWRNAVAEKGDEARTHFGIIAQDLQAAFAAEGLDAGDYAMFISSTWTDEETGEERTRMGVRYSELLAFIIGAL